MLVALIEETVRGYAPAVDRLERAVAATEAEVFGGDGDPSRRIHEQGRRTAALLRAARALADALAKLLAADPGPGDDGADAAGRRYARRARDRVLRVVERLEGLRDRLAGLLNVNLSLVATRRNDRRQDVAQKISAWAAILAIPAIVTGVYGMNFAHRPELG